MNSNENSRLFLLVDLTRLSDQILLSEAERMRNNIQKWVLHYFSLTKRQWEFFEVLTPEHWTKIARDASFAIENGFTIRLAFFSNSDIADTSNRLSQFSTVQLPGIKKSQPLQMPCLQIVMVMMNSPNDVIHLTISYKNLRLLKNIHKNNNRSI